MKIIIDIFIFFIGSVIGSFLNVCIYRIPRDKSIVHPPSFCPNCEKPIKFYDNIPIVSYILLGSKCRYCASKISIRYPLIELLTALLFLILYIKLGFTFEFFVNMVFISLLIVISFIDLDFKIIPDILSIGGLILGFLLSFVRPLFRYMDPKFGFLNALYGVLVGGGILFIIAVVYKFFAKREGMGGGDIKLLAMIGSFCGIKGVVFSLMSGSLLGTLIGIPLMLIKGEGTKYAIPFGPFLSLGALIYIYGGDILIRFFFNILSRR
jgi:leader peptidase (prepilin peptidase) / N-methyltransferase